MQLRTLTELALAISLAAVLDMVSKSMPLPRLIQGGSISLHALPIIIVAFRHGWRLGMVAGSGYGLINFVLDMHIVHPIQVPLDYPVAFAAVGLAGLGSRRFAGSTRESLTLGLRLHLGLWVFVGEGLRFLAHFVSGIVFWGNNAPAGQPVWLFSLIYNGTYMLPETIIDILLLQLMLRRILSYIA